jgi:rhodanese-related sulfurtransferase
MKNKIFIVIIVFIAILIFVIWNNRTSSSTQPQTNPQITQVHPITSDQFDQLAQNPDTFIIDVHTPEQTHIPDTDAFIDYTQIKQNQSKLPADKNTPIIIYCRSGSMSAQASQDLTELGYTQIYDLQGGTDAYKQSGIQSIAVTPDTQPLGTVIFGDIPETQFTLTNYTNQVLNVTRLSTSCGCTQAFMDHRELGPFTSAPIKVTFNPAVHGDDTDLGKLTRAIYIETDNPNYKKLETTITANVIKN